MTKIIVNSVMKKICMNHAMMMMNKDYDQWSLLTIRMMVLVMLMMTRLLTSSMGRTIWLASRKDMPVPRPFST